MASPLDVAYEALSNRGLDATDGANASKLARAYAQLPAAAGGIPALLSDARTLSMHALRLRARAQAAAITGASAAHKADPMSPELWQTHPWQQLRTYTCSQFFADIVRVEAEIVEEAAAVEAPHPVMNARRFAAWHVEFDCVDCARAAAEGQRGKEDCPWWEINIQLVDYFPPFRPDADLDELGASAPDAMSDADLAIWEAEVAKGERAGLFCKASGAEPGIGEGAVSAMHIVYKEVHPLTADARAAAAAGDTTRLAREGLAQGERIAHRAAATAAARGRAGCLRYCDYSQATRDLGGGHTAPRAVFDLTSSGMNHAVLNWHHTLSSVHSATDWVASDGQLVQDVDKGYNACRNSRRARAWLRFRHPRSGLVYELCRNVIGGKLSSPLFCVGSGLLARRIHYVCSSRSLRVAIKVYIDDFLFRVLMARLQELKGIVMDAARDANMLFKESKAQEGRAVTYCGAVLDSGGGAKGPTISAKSEHVFSFCQCIGLIRGALTHGVRVPASVFAYASGLGQFIAGFIAALKPRLGALTFAGDFYCAATMLDPRRNGLDAAVDWIAQRAASDRGFVCHRMVRRDDADTVRRLFVDASGVDGQGAGAMHENEALYRRLTPADRRSRTSTGRLPPTVTLNIELDPILGALAHWGARWADEARDGETLVVIYVDCLGAAYCINKQSARRGSVAHDRITALYDLADRFRLGIVAIWLPRVFNAICDTISKQVSAEAAAAALRALLRRDDIVVREYAQYTGCR